MTRSPNKPAAGKAGIAPRFTIAHRCPGQLSIFDINPVGSWPGITANGGPRPLAGRDC
jgi:hypothetical protein